MYSWKSKVLLFLCIGFAFSLFFYKGVRVLDSDFGWHLQMGQVILQHGIPKTDPFSYTMPSYPFVDHEWLTNVIISILYPKVGMIGLAIFFSLLAVCAIAFAANMLKTRESQILFLLAASIIAPFAGVRTQVITWFFFSLLLCILLHSSLWKKIKFFLPFLFLLWVNMHGGFAIGIVAFLVVLTVRRVIVKKVDTQDMLVLFLCFLATFLNPYGYRIWWEVWMQMSDQTLRWTISEWSPTFFNPLSMSLLLFISVSVVDIIFYRKKIAKEELILYLGLLLASQLSLRHIPLWIIVSLPIVFKSHACIKQQANTYAHGAKRFAMLEKYFGIFLLFVVSVQTLFFLQSIQETIKDFVYPARAVAYLHVHQTSGNVFSTYNWGGFLIWKLPEKKVFIDGRMPSWRWKAPNSKESGYAFQEYLHIGEGKLPLSSMIRTYHITAFLLPIEERDNKNQRLGWLTIINSSLDQMIFGKKQQKSFDLIKEIKKNGFKKVYSDIAADVYMKSEIAETQ